MAQKQVPSDSWTIHAKWAAASPAWQLERVARGVGEATFPCPQSAQSETLYVKFCYPVRVVNKCNRMPPFSLLWADPTGPLQSIVVVALAAAGATPHPPSSQSCCSRGPRKLSWCCARHWRQEVILPTASSAAYVLVAVVVAVLLLLPTLVLLLFVSVCLP